MTSVFRASRFFLHNLPLLLCLVGLTACGGERPPRPPPGAMGPGGGVPPAAVPRMEGKSLFFEDQIEVEVLFARAGMPWNRKEETATGGRRPGRGGGGFSGGMQAGMGGMGRDMGGGRDGGMGGGREGRMGGPPGGDMAGARPPDRMHASNQPPIQLRLRLTNHTGTTVDTEVLDFNSTLGNFVVQPPKITVKPGESVEAEPMISRLGVATEEIPVTVKLHVGGRTEQRVLMLRALKVPPPDSASTHGPPLPPASAAPAAPFRP
jgi:hypothetical protein